MPRQARKGSGTGIYHVMLRGINRQDIFEDQEDYSRMLPVNDIPYFVTLLRYIHQNPVKAGLVTEVDEYIWSSWREYEGFLGICSTQPVISRMPFEDLKAMVFKPLPKTAVVLDIDNERRRKTDEEVSEYIISNFGLRHAQDVLLLTKERQKDIIKQVRDFGASIRQIERLTGISFSIICRS